MHRRVHPLLLTALALVIGVGLWRLSSTPRACGELPTSAYLWQLRHDDAVRAAMTERLGTFERATVLAAEVRIDDGRVRTQRVELADDLLAGRPLALAIRVGPKAFEPEDPFADALIVLARDVVEDARARDVTVTELQLDHDCPSSRLASYAAFLQRLSADLDELDPAPTLTITALPTWLERDEMAAVADSVDSYVLQLHSLERPKHITDAVQLFEPEQARRYVERAGRLGRPFSISLPSYGYLATFRADGRFLGLVAETEPRALPEGAQQRILMADAPALSLFVRQLTDDRPASLRAIAWYRLPVDGDRLAWRWSTMRRVVKGEPVEPALSVVARPRPDDPRLVELVLRNDGAADAPVPQAVVVEHGQLLAADAHGGFSLTRRSSTSTLLESVEPARVAPGETRVVAWLRRTHADEEVRADVDG